MEHPIHDQLRRGRRGDVLGVVLGWLVTVPATAGVLADGLANGALVIVVCSVFCAALWISVMVMVTRAEFKCRRLLRDPGIGEREQLLRRLGVQYDVGKARWPFALILAFLVLWIPWKLVADWPMYSAEPWRAFVGVGGCAVIFLAVVVFRSLATRGLEQRITALQQT